MYNHKFSIIIPAYNAEKYLERAIKSVLAQTNEDWELIIVENGSKDATTEICNKYLANPKIRLFHSKKGVSNARNLGLKYSRGERILFLDADDTLPEDTLATYLSALKKNNSDVDAIVGNYNNFGGKLTTSDFSALNFLSKSLINPTQLCNVTGVLFKSEIIQKYKILFDPSLTHSEDSIFFIQYLKKSICVSSIKEIVYNVLPNDQSATNLKSQNLLNKYIMAIRKMNYVLRDNYELNSAKNVFILTQLLIVLVHETFSDGSSFVVQLNNTRKIIEIKEFRDTRKKLNLNSIKLPLTKKIVFKLMVRKRILLLGIIIKFRQVQNRLRMKKYV